MNELLQQIFNLEDPIGRTIVYWIRVFFWIGVINYGIHIARIIYESVCLISVRKYIKDNHGLGDVSSDLLYKLLGRYELLGKVGIRLSTIYRRIRDLVNIKQNGGEIDDDVLGDIHAGAASRKAGLSNYILGILIILGLVGTLWGLTTAVIEVQPLLQDIDDLDQLPQISSALQETLKGMGTAFKTTLAGLVTSLGLGALGWLFSLLNSAFLTRFETVVATEIIPYFKQTSESAIESSMDQLQVSVGEFKLATEDNVRRMQESIQQLTEKSWDAYLEQQYVIANELREIPGELRESLGGISKYQVLIKSKVASFEKMTESFMTEISKNQSTVDTMVEEFRTLTEKSMSQVSVYQAALLEGLENVVSEFKEESDGLKTTIREAQSSQARFIDELANNLADTLTDTLEKQFQPIVENQQDMMEELRVTVINIRQIADELQIRSALERQNEVFEGIRSELIQNRQEINDRLSQLISELQIIPAVEAQNQAFGRIENHLIRQTDLLAEQREFMLTLIAILQQPPETPPVEIPPTPSGDLSQQISLKLDLLNTKIDVLNDTMRQPGIYRWIWEIQRWFGSPR